MTPPWQNKLRRARHILCHNIHSMIKCKGILLWRRIFVHDRVVAQIFIEHGGDLGLLLRCCSDNCTWMGKIEYYSAIRDYCATIQERNSPTILVSTSSGSRAVFVLPKGGKGRVKPKV